MELHKKDAQNISSQPAFKELEMELQKALLEIEALVTEKNAILKTFTHDLSNPLQILSMSIESLMDRCPPEVMPTLERMKRASDNMTTIIATLRKLKSTSAKNLATPREV